MLFISGMHLAGMYLDDFYSAVINLLWWNSE